MWLLDMQKWRDILRKCSRHPKAVVKGASAVTLAAPRPGCIFGSQRRGLGSNTHWGQSFSHAAPSHARGLRQRALKSCLAQQGDLGGGLCPRLLFPHAPQLAIMSAWIPSLAPRSKATSWGLHLNELVSLKTLLSFHGQGKRWGILSSSALTCLPIHASPCESWWQGSYRCRE